MAILTTQNIKELLADVLENITGLESGRVIWEDSADPRPTEGLYCSLCWKEFEPLPQNVGEYRDDPDPLIQTLRNETWCSVQISFCGLGAFDLAAASVGALQNDNRNFDLWRLLGYAGIDSVEDCGADSPADLKPCFCFTFSFYACFEADYPADWFEVSKWDLHLPDKPYSEPLTAPKEGTIP